MRHVDTKLVAIFFLTVVVASTPWGPAHAADEYRPQHQPADRAIHLAKRHFIEFRSRRGYLFGHTYIVYGSLGPHGKRREIHYAGIYPIDEQPGLLFGSVVPVRASVRGVEDDRTQRPENFYRVPLTAGQYRHVRRTVRRLRTTERQWHLLFMNCNDFAIKVAREIGLRTPASLLLPKLFVANLYSLNKP